jgi:hypothetical protein
MRHLPAITLAATLLLPVATHAQTNPAIPVRPNQTTPPQAATEAPQTIELPGDDLNALVKFLLHPPMNDHIDPGDVIDFIAQIRNCATMQVPVNGVIRDRGQCPAVTTALAARRAQQDQAVTAAVEQARADAAAAQAKAVADAVAKQKAEDEAEATKKTTMAPMPKP